MSRHSERPPEMDRRARKDRANISLAGPSQDTPTAPKKQQPIARWLLASYELRAWHSRRPSLRCGHRG